MALSGDTVHALANTLGNGVANDLTNRITGLQREDLADATLTTAGAGTITAASIAGGEVRRSGPTSSFTDTTDTAANIKAAVNPVPGQSWEFIYVNQTAFSATLSGGTGVTIAGIAGPVPGNATARFLVTYPSDTLITMTLHTVGYNTPNGYEPANVATQFGASTGTFLGDGNINIQISSAGVTPASTGNDNVLAFYSLPASALDGIGNRGLYIVANGKYAANASTKEVKLYFNATTAVVGSAVTGGTVIADTGAVATNNQGWCVAASIYKYGAAGSNTQLCIHQQAQSGTTIGALLSPSLTTATESGAILIAVTGNATTTATDIVFNFLQVTAMN